MPLTFDLKNPFDHFEKALFFSNITMTGANLARNHYAQASRSYHGIFHIGFLWHCYNELKFSLPDQTSTTMFLAADFIVCHDTIMKYGHGHGASEKASAKFWMTHNMVNGSTEETFVESAILASADHLADRPANSDYALMEWLLGLDLIPLAAPDEIFDQNSLMLRAENRHLSDQEWDRLRRQFLGKFKAAPVIYRNPYLRSQFEAAARQNIERALA